MQIKNIEKQKAISLRRQGKTYSEILKVVPVAKSTLSLWLRDVGLAVAQKQVITAKRIEAAKRGGVAKRNIRISIQNRIISAAKAEIGSVSERELFLIGVILYWAEGSKEKEWYPGSKLCFSNMDPRMIKLFLRWLVEIAKVPTNMIGFDIYLHENHSGRVPEVIKYWQRVTGFPGSWFDKVYFKRTKTLTTNRHNVGENYFGLMRITVRNSSGLVRQIAGWTEGVVSGI